LNNNFAFDGEVSSRFSLKSLPGASMQKIGRGYPTQCRFGVHFVDILAARTATTREAPLQLRLGYFQVACQLNAGHFQSPIDIRCFRQIIDGPSANYLRRVELTNDPAAIL
jgi:hypothetical protein